MVYVSSSGLRALNRVVRSRKLGCVLRAFRILQM